MNLATINMTIFYLLVLGLLWVLGLALGLVLGLGLSPRGFIRDKVRKYCNVQNRAFPYFLMRDLEQYCAQFLYVNQIHNPRCENRAFPIKIMRDFII